MPKANALILEKIHPSVDEELGSNDVAITRIDKGLDEAELIAALRGLGDGPLIVGIRSKTRLTERVIEAVPQLSAVGAFCIGTDQIALDTARARGIAVFNAPFSSTRSVAELVIAEIVMLSRQTFMRSKAAHEGRWEKSSTGSREVRGKTLGIVGYGHIGSQLGILAEAFGMRVLFYDSEKKLPLGNVRAVATLEELLTQSEFVSLHVPDTELTRGMMGRAQLEAMRPGAYLVNASRGKVVDIGALTELLLTKHLGGAAIDVFPREPDKEGDRFESELQGVENVILTPHVGGSTLEAQANIGLEVALALNRYLQLGSTRGCVTLPQLDVPPPAYTSVRTSRIVNLHQNVPGVLSSINRVVAESGVNIIGQSLRTLEDVGLLFIDIPVTPDESRATQLRAAISALPTSIRTRLLEL